MATRDDVLELTALRKVAKVAKSYDAALPFTADELRALVMSAGELWDNIDRNRAGEYLSGWQQTVLSQAHALYLAGPVGARDRTEVCGYCGSDVKLAPSGLYQLAGEAGHDHNDECRACTVCSESPDNRHDPEGDPEGDPDIV
jgi:hypothetical protein